MAEKQEIQKLVDAASDAARTGKWQELAKSAAEIEKKCTCTEAYDWMSFFAIEIGAESGDRYCLRTLAEARYNLQKLNKAGQCPGALVALVACRSEEVDPSHSQANYNLDAIKSAIEIRPSVKAAIRERMMRCMARTTTMDF